MKRPDSRPTPLETLADLGFDPHAVLARDPGVMLDPRFLSALRGELLQEFGEAEAAVTLTQIGFLHGLVDAQRVVGSAFAARGGSGPPTTPVLPIRFRTHPGGGAGGPPGAIEVRGFWPERSEAQAVLRSSPVGSGAHCHVSEGYTSGWLSGITEADLLALETHCCAAGAERCQFVAREPEVWRARGDARALELLESLPFRAFRDFAARQGAAPAPPEQADPDAFDPEAAVIHIWGPVMVIPYSGSDEALRAVDLIGRDAGARNVSVVVVDLSGAIVDEAFGAAALEQIVEAAEAWGAEVLMAGVGPLSERVVSELERPPLMVHKDLRQAIAAGFQIADAQRRVV